MKKNTNYVDETRHFERMLREYHFYCKKYLDHMKEARRLSLLLDEELEARGINYQSTGASGSSYMVSTYANELILLQASEEEEAKKAEREFMRIDRIEKINERIGRLNMEDRLLIESRYFDEMTLKSIAKSMNYSDHTYIQKRLKRVLEKMVAMEP